MSWFRVLSNTSQDVFTGCSSSPIVVNGLLLSCILLCLVSADRSERMSGESRTTLSGFFEVLYIWDDGVIALGKGHFCLNMSMGNSPCLLVKP
jgi:hypothetical protein